MRFLLYFDVNKVCLLPSSLTVPDHPHSILPSLIHLTLWCLIVVFDLTILIFTFPIDDHDVRSRGIRANASHAELYPFRMRMGASDAGRCAHLDYGLSHSVQGADRAGDYFLWRVFGECALCVKA
jgi:hypothetical protein